ncbi:MAG: hypothetical protein PWP48_1017, partial [Clostridiales bacterium]|nr:hypothetical protein [Clostridiales bacterium]
MNQDEQRTLIELLEEIPDPRRGNRIQHNLKDIILIGIMSIVCGANSFTGMEIWGQTHEELLRQFLELPYGIPSHDTFGDVFSALSPRHLEECFNKWLVILREDVNDAKLVAIDGGGDYVLALKANHANLLEDVKYYFENEVLTQKKKDLKQAGQYAKKVEKGHGRIETRECYISNDVEWLEEKDKWAGLGGIGLIKSKRELSDGTVTIQDHYFLYSLKDTTAGEIMEIKRSHWSIENNLHWVLDMTFREDESRMRIKHSAENINILRKLALELIKHETSVKGSIKSKRQR